MKKVLSLILCIVFITTLLPIVPFTASAANDTYTWYITADGTLVINGMSGMDYDTFPWESRKDEIKHVSIGLGVTGIQAGAFKDYTALESVSFPEKNLFSIGEEAFSGCTSLKSISLPPSRIRIKKKAFYGCTALESVDMPSAVPIPPPTQGGFGTGAIVGNPWHGTEVIEDYAFEGCVSLKSISIPNTILLLGTGVFKDCTALENIKINKTLNINADFLENTAFYNDKDNWKDGILYFKSSLIKVDKEVESVHVKNGISYIGTGAFNGCDKLKEVILPESVHQIGAGLFDDCINLEKIIISSNEINISEGEFANCENLTIICKKDSTADKFATENNIDCIRYEAVGTCGEKIYWTLDSDYTLELIGTGNMNNHSRDADDNPTWYNYRNKINKVKIGKGITDIGDRSFYRFEEMTSIEIPDSVTRIGEGAFIGCDKLKIVEIPNSVTTIGEASFAECDSLEEVKIPDSVTTIEKEAFLRSPALKEIYIPKNVTTIGDGVFAGGNISVKVDEENLNYLSLDGALYNKDMTELLYCGNFEGSEYTIIGSVEIIGARAFYNKKGLKKINFTYNDSACALKEIKTYAFYECDGLTRVEIPEGVTDIGSDAFYGCDNLVSVTLPRGIAKIGQYAFDRCKNLVLKCYIGVATDYATRENIPYEAIGDASIPNNYPDIDIGNDTKPVVSNGGGGDSKPKKPVVGLANFKTVNTYDNSFTDVESDAWYYDSIKAAYELDLVNGKGGDKYDPTGNISIAEAITLVARIHSIYKTGTGFFNPWVPWYEVYVDYAIVNDIIAEDRFTDFNAPATRAEFAEIFAKALPEADFNVINNIEKGKIPDVAESEAVYLLYNAGILTGSDEAHSFKPESNIQRSEVATIVTRIVNKEKRVTFEIE